ncbi:helix-turn-helix domain-containing protein [Pseudaminobacter sp. NGMCC 1.201702]|uniref:helix-turn-helix domain-containing protein n=1 Tax=Pseudaminobacter sp. NGMCC 1.201702 TaxID=3391825 RepID=UPI0039EE17F7
MSFLAAYSRNTMAGAARIAAQRERARLAQLPATEPKPAPAAAPEPSNVVSFKTPKDELLDIIDKVARMHGSTFRAVMSKCRTDKIAHARQACICAVKEARPGMSLPQIGRVFGVDHSSVLHSLKKRGYK